MRTRPFPALILLFLGASCASIHNIGNVVDPVSHGASTPASPATTWTPPPNAIPPKVAPPNDLVLPPSGVPLELAQIVDLALSNNPATRTTWLESRLAEANLGSVRSAYLPTVDLGASLTRAHTSAGTATTLSGPTLSLDYLLLDFGGRNAAAEAARQTLIASGFTHNQTIQDVILGVEQAYYDYLDAKALLTAQEATIKERQTSLDSPDARHPPGLAPLSARPPARPPPPQASPTHRAPTRNRPPVEGTAARHNNQARDRGVKGNVKYRFGIGMATLKTEKTAA